MEGSVMPFMVVNYGAEMLFILNARLIAQQIEPAKAKRIMHDIVINLFSSSFMDELFRPMSLYTPSALRGIFVDLLESTIMHLSENSISKLYELMKMGVKYQLFTLRHPLELIAWTFNHLDEIITIVPAERAIIAAVAERLRQRAAVLSAGDCALIRQALLNTTIGHRVKVSLFLEEHLQMPSGSFYIAPDTYLSPTPTCEAPGLIRLYARGKLQQTATFASPAAHLVPHPNRSHGPWDPCQPAQRVTTNGRNLYTTGGDTLGLHSREMPTRRAPAPPPAAPSVTQANAFSGEMNALAQRVRGGASLNEKFRLDLFGGDDGEPPAVRPGEEPAADPQQTIQVCKLDVSRVLEENRELLGIITELGEPAQSPDGDDLLDIMDQT